jgi:hypothetical protein
VSVGVFAPGEDYSRAVEAIMYQRQCIDKEKSKLVRELATFHIFFPIDHFPPKGAPIMRQKKLANYNVDCEEARQLQQQGGGNTTYKDINGLTYPVNVARNVARECATTHFIFPSDIELYPNPGLIENFLAMIRHNPLALRSNKPKVFVNPIFEIREGFDLPVNKSSLVEYLLRGVVIPFHKHICSQCHQIPEADKWQEEDLTSSECLLFSILKC